MKRCGNCFFARLNPQIIAQDISKRVCYGAPPSAIQLPTTGGRMTLQMARPIVGVTEDACSLHRAKDEADTARDHDAMHELQQMKNMETKQ